MKRAQKNFERDPTKKNFWSSETQRERKQEITNKVRDLISRNAHPVQRMIIPKSIAKGLGNLNRINFTYY